MVIQAEQNATVSLQENSSATCTQYFWIRRDVLNVEANIESSLDGCSANLADTMRFMIYGKWNRTASRNAQRMRGFLGDEDSGGLSEIRNVAEIPMRYKGNSSGQAETLIPVVVKVGVTGEATEIFFPPVCPQPSIL